MKPENILLIKNDQSHVKIIDFGSAIFIKDNDKHFEMQTLPYRAPEIILRAEYDYAIDIWSLGCILYELVTHEVLFSYNCERKNFIKGLAINRNYDLSVFENIRNDTMFEQNLPILQRSLADKN